MADPLRQDGRPVFLCEDEPEIVPEFTGCESLRGLAFPRIPTGYLEDGGLDHAYAMTIHKAQGLTCDRAFVLGDELLHREAAYTALSRGRHENRLYTVLPGKYEPYIPEPVRRTPEVNRTLEQSMSKYLARDRSTPERSRGAEVDQGIDIGW